MSATPTGALDNPDTRIEFAAKGRVEGLVVPEGVAVPPELGRDIDWALAGNATRDGSTVDLSSLSTEGAGLGSHRSRTSRRRRADQSTGMCVLRSPTSARSPASSVTPSPAR